LGSSAGPGGQATNKDLQLKFDPIDMPESEDDDEDDDDDGGKSGESKILKLFQSPLFNNQSASDYFRKMFGGSRSPGEGAAGAEMTVRSTRRVQEIGPNARPLPTRIHFTDDGKPGAAVGVGGALYPEWDVFNDRYKPDWCRVIDFPLTVAADVSHAGVAHDDVLRRRLARVGLGPKVLRGRADGDDLDIEALIDLFVDLQSGFSAPEHVYLERRKLARNLGVLILIDASGSMRGERATFARGMALAAAKKLLLSGEDVVFRFFDARLYEPHPARSGQLPVAHLLSFKGERGRNPARVFLELDTALELLLERDGRQPIVHLFTHAALYIPRSTVEKLIAKAKLACVFMLPSGGSLDLDYLDLLDAYWVVDHKALSNRGARAREARRILDDVGAQTTANVA